MEGVGARRVRITAVPSGMGMNSFDEGGDADRGVTTCGVHPNSGKYLANLTARITTWGEGGNPLTSMTRARGPESAMVNA